MITALKGDDLILCQITSQARADEYSIPLDDAGIIVYRAGHISQVKLEEAVDRLIKILRQS